MLQHAAGIVDRAVTGGLGTDQAAAEGEALAGDDAAGEAAGEAAPGAEEEAHFPAAHADVAGGHVHVRPHILIQLGHEALAETHDFGVGLALGVEVAAALGTAHGQGGQGVFQHLLEAQELDRALGDAGMEAQAALVGADSAVELHTPAPVDMGLALVVAPGNAEFHHPVRCGHPLQNGVLLILGMLGDDRLQRSQDFLHGLDELGHRAVVFLDGFQYTFHISVHVFHSISIRLRWACAFNNLRL